MFKSKKSDKKSKTEVVTQNSNKKTDAKHEVSSFGSASSATNKFGTTTSTKLEVRETKTFSSQTWSTSTYQRELKNNFLTHELPSPRPSLPSTSQPNNFHLNSDSRPIVLRSISSTYTSPTQFRKPYADARPFQTTAPIYSSPVPTYEHDKNKKLAKVLIINNKTFDTSDMERKGAEFDEQSLMETCSRLNYSYKIKRDLSASQMKKTIDSFASDKDLKNYNMSILIACSHGTNANQRGGYTEIYGKDNKGVILDDIIKLFTRHSHLAGKPKILIFQCCRGEKEENAAVVEPDAIPFREHGDMLIAYSTLPGFKSYRTRELGSWYIQSFCAAVERHADTLDIESIFKIVDEDLNRQHPTIKQTSVIESRGFKKCFLKFR